MAISNRQAEIGVYRTILSDPVTGDKEAIQHLNSPPLISTVQTAATQQAKSLGLQQIKAKLQAKQSNAVALVKRLNRRPLQQVDGNERKTPPPRRSVTSPPVQMELI